MQSVPRMLAHGEAIVHFRAVVVGAIVVHLLTAWFNGGYLNADEHYQIVEFAQYKLGHQVTAGLAWEFAARIRPALQPWLAADAIRLGHAIGVCSPFLIAFGLRVMSALVSLWATVALCARCLRAIPLQMLRLLGLLVSCFFWITPAVHSRFASETWGGALFVGGLCLMLDALDADSDAGIKTAMLGAAAGLLWSAAFYCRFQTGALIAGAGLWLLFVPRVHVSLLLTIAGSFLIGCGLNVVIDHWLYDGWTFTPYNYVVTNLVQGKAATFGAAPWWMPGVYLAVGLIPPYSLGLLALLGAGCWYARRHVLVWATIPFIVMHAAVAHKEPRFLVPMVFVVGPLIAVSTASLPERLREALFAWLQTRSARVHVAGWGAINMALLCMTMFIPANDSYLLNHWLWRHTQRGSMTLYTVGESPIRVADPPTDTFYENSRVVVQTLDSATKLQAMERSLPAYIYFKGSSPPPMLAALGVCTPVLRTFPPWLAQIANVAVSIKVNPGTICRMDGTP